MQEKPGKIRSFQAVRAIAALMVVVYHGYIIFDEQKYWNHSWKKYLLFGHSGVEFFFVLSGAVICNAHWSQRGQPRALAAYAWRRVRRIYPVYWCVLAFVLLLSCVVSSVGAVTDRRVPVLLSSIILVHIQSTGTVLGVAWTLYHELMFYALFGLVLVNRSLGLSLLSVWMGCALHSLVAPPANEVLLAYSSPLHLLFGFGMLAMLLARSVRLPVPHVILLCGILWFLTQSVVENLTDHPLPMATVSYGGAATLCLLGLMELERTRRITVPPLLLYLGDASYSIYLVHQLALSTMAKFIYPLWLRMQVPRILPFVVLVIASTAIGVVVHVCIERPLLRLVPAGRQNFKAGLDNPKREI